MRMPAVLFEKKCMPKLSGLRIEKKLLVHYSQTDHYHLADQCKTVSSANPTSSPGPSRSKWWSEKPLAKAAKVDRKIR